MKIRIFITLVLCLIVPCSVGAQSTTLTIDNQSPGWLSSKIGYGDQQTLENVVVTGYLNSEDLLFLHALPKLDGIIDLTNANFVTANSSNKKIIKEDNIILRAALTGFNGAKKLLLPLSLRSIGELFEARIDTLVLGGPDWHLIDLRMNNYASSHSYDVIEFREGVDSLIMRTMSEKLKHVILPNSLKYLKWGLTRINLESFELPVNIEEIYDQGYASPSLPPIFLNQDTIIYPPKLRVLHFGGSQGTCNVAYFPESIERIVTSYYSYDNSTNTHPGYEGTIHAKEVHFAGTQPPQLTYYSLGVVLKGVTVYVPKGCIHNYRNSGKCWENVTILEEPIHVASIKLSTNSLSLQKDETRKITATIFPHNADNQLVVWSTGNGEIASVSSDGIVRAESSGSTYIYAYSYERPNVMDSCRVVVSQPVTEVKLSSRTITLEEGDSKQLFVLVSPSDADNAACIWESSSPSIVEVNDTGIVNAKCEGTAIITVRAEENYFIFDECAVIVNKRTIVSPFDVNADGMVDVGDVNAVLGDILAGGTNAAFDVNGDGNVDVGDVNAILQSILAK